MAGLCLHQVYISQHWSFFLATYNRKLCMPYAYKKYSHIPIHSKWDNFSMMMLFEDAHKEGKQNIFDEGYLGFVFACALNARIICLP